LAICHYDAKAGEFIGCGELWYLFLKEVKEEDESGGRVSHTDGKSGEVGDS